MKVSTESTENRRTILNIEVESQEMDESLDKAYRHLIKRVNIPGFRKGKAPRHMLEHFIGKEGLQQEALDDLIPRLCNQAIEEQKMDIIAQPEVEILQADPVVFKAIFSLRPQVELGEYHEISLTADPVEVTEEQINNVIEQLRDGHAAWNPAEHTVCFGDMAIIDIEEVKEGVSVNKYQGQQYMVNQDSVLPFPGFAEQIVGMAKDEEKEFSLSYPDDYPIKELKGKEYNFKVKVTEVKEKHLPDLNDEFAKSIGEDLETLDALKENIATSLKNIAEEKAKRDFEQKVIEAAVDLAKVEYPPILVEQEINRFLNERERMLVNQGGLESYLKNINKTEEEVKEEIRPEATKQLIQSLVLAKISDDEKVEVDATEIDSEIEGMLKNTGDDEDRMRELLGSQQGRQWIKERLTIQKTVQLLSEIAIGNSTKVEVEE